MMSLSHLQLFTVTREFLQRSHIWRGVDCFLWRCLIKQHLSTICMVMFNKPSIIGWSHWFGLAALWNQSSLANLRLWLTSDNNSLEHSKLHVDQVALLRSISEEIRGDETQIRGDEIQIRWDEIQIREDEIQIRGDKIQDIKCEALEIGDRCADLLLLPTHLRSRPEPNYCVTQ